MKYKDFSQKIRNPFLLLAGVFLLVFSYPAYGLWPLAWIALVPLVPLIFSLKSGRSAALYGFLFGTLFYALLLNWLVPTMLMGGVELPAALLALFLLSILLSLEFVIIFLAGWKSKKFGVAPFALVWSSSWVLVEFSKMNADKIAVWFPWFSLAYSQWNNPPVLRLAYYGGTFLITFLMVFFQSFLGGLFVKKKILKRVILNIFVLAVFLFAVFTAGNFVALPSRDGGKKIKAAIIQPSVELYKKWDSVWAASIKERVARLLTEAAAGKPDLIIWPENALPGWIDDKEIFSWLSAEVKKTGCSNIVGSVSRSDGKFVSAFLISPEGEIVQEYRKRNLVPFGEYVPMRGLLGKYVNAVGALGEFSPGAEEQGNFILNGIKTGPSICYEALFPRFFAAQEEAGADFFFNITNDGWYLDTGAPRQHFAAAVFRAAENGLPFARAANNGISAFINPDGSVEKKLELNEIGVLSMEIPLKPAGPERFSLLGKNFVVYLSLMISGAFILAALLI